jgi:hypothetical protein
MLIILELKKKDYLKVAFPKANIITPANDVIIQLITNNDSYIVIVCIFRLE